MVYEMQHVDFKRIKAIENLFYNQLTTWFYYTLNCGFFQ